MRGVKGHPLLITGASGFVGRYLQKTASDKKMSVRRTLRRRCGMEGAVVGDLGPCNDWSAALENIDVVVHLAARVHVDAGEAVSSITEFRRVNVDGSANLARQAALAGVHRLVFVSSIKVNGEGTHPGVPFTSADAPEPRGPYAVSKLEAEKALRRVEQETGLEVVIIRPPLIYGPGVKANFFRLMKAVQNGVPLPFGRVKNMRSLAAIENLVDLIMTCIDHPAAAGKTFLVSDGEDLSTPALIRKLAMNMDRPARLLPVPPALLRLCGRVVGKMPETERLIGSLQVDIRHTCDTLGWQPLVSVDDALRQTCRDFISKRKQ